MSDTTPQDRAALLIPGLDEVLGLGLPPALVYEAPGHTHTITVEDARAIQDRNFDTGELEVWPSGDPKKVLVIIGADEDGADACDWIRGARKSRAYRQALLAAKVQGVARGDVVTITRGPDEEIPPAKKGGKTLFANTWTITIVPAGVK